MDKKDSHDKLAGKPWVRLREIAYQIDRAEVRARAQAEQGKDVNAVYRELTDEVSPYQKEAQRTFAEWNGHPQQVFWHSIKGWREIADWLEREDKQ